MSLYETILEMACKDGGVYPHPDTFQSDACNILAKHALLDSLGDGQFAITALGCRAWETCQSVIATRA